MKDEFLPEKYFLDKIKSCNDNFLLLEAGIDKSKQVILALEGIEEKQRAVDFTQSKILEFLREENIPFYYTLSENGNIKILYDTNTPINIPHSLETLVEDNFYCSQKNSNYFPKISIGVTDITESPELTLVRGEESFAKAEEIEAGTIAYLFHDDKRWIERKEDLYLIPKINEVISSSSKKKLEDHLILHQQSIVPLFSSTNYMDLAPCPHFEILSRFYLDNGDNVPTESLFRALEKDKIIGSFDICVFKRAFEELGKLERLNHSYKASINVSEPNTANPGNFFSNIDQYRNLYDITPQNIWIEISEKCNNDLSDFVTMASERGYNISYDDYGKGGTNIEKLKNEVLGDPDNPRIDPSKVNLKIDKDYILKLGQYKECRLDSAYGLILLGLRLSSDYDGLKIIAEGVENEMLEKKLQKISFGKNSNRKHITYGQGFLYDKPSPLHEFIEDIIYNK